MLPYRRALVLLCAGVLILTDGTALARMQIIEEGYLLPLVNRYAIHCEGGPVAQSGENGGYQLVQLSTSPQGPAYYRCNWTTLLPGIEQIALLDMVIVGKTRDRYFLLDGVREDAKPQIVDTVEKLEAAMAATGVSGPLQWTSPDAMAATKPQLVLRPWRYRMMGNALGRSDDEWSVMVQIAGAAIAFIVGFLGRPRRPLMPAALALGIIVNIVAQMFLGGGGGSAFAGFIIYPLLYYVVAVVGRAVRWLASFIRPAQIAAACNASEDKSSHT